MSSQIKIIAGIGNPGATYKKTRHNVGIWLVDRLQKDHNLEWRHDKKLFGFITELNLNNQKIWLFKPSTYMNESGRALSAIMNYFKIASNALVIAHDDLDLDPGIIKVKYDGGHGGHNGLSDIISSLQTKKFCRIRIGIGHPGHKDLVHNYVLGKPNKTDEIKITQSIEDMLFSLSDLIEGNLDKLMQTLHSRRA